MNLADLRDKAAKNRQKETKEGTGDHRAEKTNWRKEKRLVLSKCAQQAPVHYYVKKTDA